jgi:hypothetical protein
MKVLGIDPGAEGGIAIVSAVEAVAEVMPVTERDHSTKRLKSGKAKQIREIDEKELVAWIELRREDVVMAVIEEPAMRPGQGFYSAFRFGLNAGIVQGVLSGLGIPYVKVPGNIWSAAFEHDVPPVPRGASAAEKERRKRLVKDERKNIVRRLYPDLDLRPTPRSKVAHEGMTDAVLIAHWAWKLRTRGVA